ncbi:MAG: ATP-binding protein [Chitinivibrionia bacterium]|nr:ATP-binding protein [Chitinivibrionia bacterium]
MAKNNKSFSIVIPAMEKYIPLVRRYVIEILAAYNFCGSFLYQMEIIIDELCLKIAGKIKKNPDAVWFDIKFEIGENNFSFDILGQRQDYLQFSQTEDDDLEEHGINSPVVGLIERYCDSARLDLVNGKIIKVEMSRSGKAVKECLN